MMKKQLLKLAEKYEKAYPFSGDFVINVGKENSIQLIEKTWLDDKILYIAYPENSGINKFGIKSYIKNVKKKDAKNIAGADRDYYLSVIVELNELVLFEDVEITENGIFAIPKLVDVELGASIEELQKLKNELLDAFVENDVNKYFESDFNLLDLDLTINDHLELLSLFTKNIIEPTDELVDVIRSNATIKERYQKAIEFIKISSIRNKVRDEIKEKTAKNIEKSQREYALLEELKVIKKELGETNELDKIVEEYEKRIKKSDMPQRIKDKAFDELNRLKTLHPQNSDVNIVQQFLDYILSLPWKTESEENTDLKDVKNILDKSHYGMEKAKERILEYLAVKKFTGKTPKTILCFVGAPGVGKTSLAFGIAEALGRKLVKQSLGGISDENEIRGHRRTYVGAMPGRIIKGMIEAGTINPIFVLDEIDKLGSTHKGNPADALLEVLDPEQNKRFRDNYIGEEYDLSKVMFIATANYLDQIPHALRDRMEIIEISSYTEHDKINIAKNYLIPRQLKEHGLDEEKITFQDGVLKEIIRKYTAEAGVRELERKIATICRKAVTKIMIENVEKISVTNENIIDFLGKPIFDDDENEYSEPTVGKINGLAYTAFGGKTMPIETTYFEGKGNYKVLPSTDRVSMIEDSLQTVMSVIKSYKDELGIPKNIDLSKIDIVVNFRGQQAINSVDGPSAGVAMFLAILSALTGKKLKQDFGITGAISLRGDSLPVGGIKEKAIGCYNYGLKKMFIPEKNKKDVVDIPENIKQDMEIVKYSHVLEIIDEVFVDEVGTIKESFFFNKANSRITYKDKALAKSNKMNEED